MPEGVLFGSTGAQTERDDASDLDLGAELDDTVRRDAEKLGRPRRNAYQSGIEALAPPRHPGTRTRFDVSATDKERELIRIKFQPRNVRSSQLPR